MATDAAMTAQMLEAAGLTILPTGVVLIGVCLAVHSVFMFMILKTHSMFASACPALRGVRMLVPSILLANGLNTAILFALMSSLARRRSGYEEFFH